MPQKNNNHHNKETENNVSTKALDSAARVQNKVIAENHNWFERLKDRAFFKIISHYHQANEAVNPFRGLFKPALSITSVIILFVLFHPRSTHENHKSPKNGYSANIQIIESNGKPVFYEAGSKTPIRPEKNQKQLQLTLPFTVSTNPDSSIRFFLKVAKQHLDNNSSEPELINPVLVSSIDSNTKTSYHFNRHQQKDLIKSYLHYGKVDYYSKKRPSYSRFAVTTKNMTGAVIGTSFTLRYDQSIDSSFLQVWEGKVKISDSTFSLKEFDFNAVDNKQTSKTMIITAGYQLTAGRDLESPDPYLQKKYIKEKISDDLLLNMKAETGRTYYSIDKYNRSYYPSSMRQDGSGLETTEKVKFKKSITENKNHDPEKNQLSNIEKRAAQPARKVSEQNKKAEPRLVENFSETQENESSIQNEESNNQTSQKTGTQNTIEPENTQQVAMLHEGTEPQFRPEITGKNHKNEKITSPELEKTITYPVMKNARITSANLFYNRYLVVLSSRNLLKVYNIEQMARKQKNQLLWERILGVPYRSNPVVHGSTMILSSHNGSTMALNLFNGAILWRSKTAAAIAPGREPVVVTTRSQTKAVIIGGTDGKIIALRLHDGSLLWQRNLRTGIFTSPSISGSRSVAIAASDNNLYNLDTTNGNVLFKYKTSKSLTGAKAIAYNRYLFLGSSDGYLHALSPMNGELVFKIRLSGSVLNIHTMRRMIYVVTSSGNLHALDLNGRRLWHKKVQDVNNFYMARYKNMLVLSQSKSVHILNYITGALLNSYTVPTPVQGGIFTRTRGSHLEISAAIADGYIWQHLSSH